MTPEQFHQVETLLHEALARDAGARAAFLAQSCGKDEELRREVESLLAAHGQMGDFIQSPALEVAAKMIAAERTHGSVGRRVGHYQALSLLGAGGMGEVYLAERADAQYRKQVAIKLVRPGMDSRSVVDRFGYERQILASLDHPNIAKLLDGGVSEDGLPYFVMDYIEGVPIDEYCDNGRLSVVKRLELFRVVCSAVHYAHQNLVVHRDLKPTNILVTDDGTPKLLDFGIAKIVSPVPSSDSDAATTLRFLTPEYASPEQVKGQPVTTASDVYSLGALLYKLLTGQSPYRLETRSAPDLARAICEEEPERPSLVERETERLREGEKEKQRQSRFPSISLSLRPSFSRSQLRGDLDNIALMALRKEPQRRYSSVEQFSEDIRRHLEGLPVIARKDTVVYRTTRFIQRHKAGVGALALMLIILLAGVISTRRQARVAERRFNEVRKLANSSLFEVHGFIENLPGSTPAREMLVKNALEYLGSLAAEAGDDPQLQQELAAAYEKVGDVQGNPYRANLGDNKGALASYQRALTIRQALLARDQGNTKTRRELAGAYDRIGDVLRETGDLEEGLKSYRQTLLIFQQLSAEDQNNRELRRELAKAHEKVGDIQGNSFFTNLGDTAGAIESQRRANEIIKSLLEQDTGNRQARRDLAVGMGKMGQMMWTAGDNAGAQECYRRCLAISRELVAEDPVDARMRRILGGAYDLIGDTQLWGGDFTLALENYHQSLQIRESLATADPANAQARRDLAISYRKVGNALQKKGAFAQAIGSFRKALTICEALVAASPVNVQARRDLILCHLMLGEAQDRSGDLATALKSHRQALNLAEKLARETPKNKHAKETLGECYKYIGDSLLKMAALREALEAYQNEQRLADDLAAADPKSAESRFEMALSRSKVGEAYAALASRGSLTANQRVEHWRNAQSLFRQSLEIFLELQSRGALRAMQAGEPERIKKELAKCDAALARRQGASGQFQK